MVACRVPGQNGGSQPCRGQRPHENRNKSNLKRVRYSKPKSENNLWSYIKPKIEEQTMASSSRAGVTSMAYLEARARIRARMNPKYLDSSPVGKVPTLIRGMQDARKIMSRASGSTFAFNQAMDLVIYEAG